MSFQTSGEGRRSGAVAVGLFVSALTLVSLAFASTANAVIFNDRSAFEATLGTFITDDYSDPGYFQGDRFDLVDFDVHTDGHMSDVLGETRYTTTGPNRNDNAILGQRNDPYYCSGCLNSYHLDFTSTSIGTANGVFGVGLDVLIEEEEVFGTTAFVTYGDGTTENFAIPGEPTFTTDQFWGITDSRLISSIAFGLPDGVTTGSLPLRFRNPYLYMAHDNLTIGMPAQVQVLPEPSAVLLFGLGLAGLGFAKRRAANDRPATTAVRS